MMGDLSAHFSRAEFTDHSDGSLPRGYPVPQLVQVLEAIRHARGGRPIRIVSGYRSPAHNRAVGGASRSQHLVGRAADLEPGVCSGATALRLGARGVGVDRSGWAVHVDVREGPVTVFADV